MRARLRRIFRLADTLGLSSLHALSPPCGAVSPPHPLTRLPPLPSALRPGNEVPIGYDGIQGEALRPAA